MIFAYHGTKTDANILNSILEFNFQKVGNKINRRNNYMLVRMPNPPYVYRNMTHPISDEEV